MSTIKSNKKATSIRLDNELYVRIEKLAKQENRSLNNYIETLLFNAIGYEPNQETIEAIEESKRERKTAKRYDNVEDLLEDLSAEDE